MTYAEILNKSNIVKNIPLMFNGVKLPKGMSASVVLVRVQYDKLVEDFNKSMEGILKELKKEGFDERAQKNQRMLDIDARKEKAKNWKEGDKDENGKEIEKPELPTDNELKEADETRKSKNEFDKELEELDIEYRKAYEEKLREDIDFKEKKFTIEEFAELIEMIGSEGTINVNGNEVPKEVFFNSIGVLFVEK